MTVPCGTWGRGLALALCAGLWVGAHAEVTVTVDATKVGAAVNREVLAGFNFGNWMPVAEFKDELGKVPAGALRFPGGNIGDEQDMDAPSIDTFQSLLSLVVGQPTLMVQTRVFRGRPDRPAANQPEDAAAAARMFRSRGLRVGMWEIGNEPDLFDSTRGDPSWTPERYCEVFRAQAAALREVDPGALIAGPAVSGALPGARTYLEAFLAHCGDVVDVLTWHIYPTRGDGDEAWALSTISQVDDDIAHYRALLRDPKRNPKGHRRSIQLGVTEFGLSWNTERPRFLGDQTAGLWAAEAALRMARQEVTVAHYFAYQATGFHGLLDLGGVPRPTYYGFGMLGQLRGQFVSAVSGDSTIWSHATLAERRLQLVLINTATHEKVVKVAAAGYRPVGARGFTASVVEAEGPLTPLPSQGQGLIMPPRSMALVELEVQP